LVIIGVVVTAFYTAEKDLLLAMQCEKQKLHQEAVYHYAIATVTSCFFKDKCHRKINDLWKKYGPFEYAELYESTTKYRDGHKNFSRKKITNIIKESLPS